MPTDNNSLPRLLDLNLRVEDCPHEQARKDVRVDLRVHRSEIDAPDGSVIAVKLKKVTLDLDLSGLEVVPATRLNEPVREHQIVEKQTTTVRTNLEGKLEAQAGVDLTKLNPAALKLAAKAVVEAKATTLHTSKQTLTEYRVTARGGDTWEVCEPRDKSSGSEVPALDGTYLLNEALCKVASHKGANMQSVSIDAFAKQRDMVLELSSGKLWQTFVNASQEKLFGVLVAKSLGLVGNKYAGVVKLSRSETEVSETKVEDKRY